MLPGKPRPEVTSLIPTAKLGLPAPALYSRFHLCTRLSFEKRPCALPGPPNQPHILAQMSICLSRPPSWDLIPKEPPSNCSPPPAATLHTRSHPGIPQTAPPPHPPPSQAGGGGSDGANYPWVIIIQLIITGSITPPQAPFPVTSKAAGADVQGHKARSSCKGRAGAGEG